MNGGWFPADDHSFAPASTLLLEYQRREGLQLWAINDFNRLTNDFIARELFHQPRPPEWFAAINTAGATIEVLFSRQASFAVQAVDQMIKPGFGLDGTKSVSDFVKGGTRRCVPSTAR